MAQKPNPLPILCKRFGVKLGTVKLMLPKTQRSTEYLHRLVKKKEIDKRTHARLCSLTLECWGKATDGETKKLLWDCYFPNNKPHLWHVLYYQLNIPMHLLTQHSGLTEEQIKKYLRNRKMPQLHVQKIARFAMKARDELSSKRRIGGPDERAQLIQEALTDRSRMYFTGEIIND